MLQTKWIPIVASFAMAVALTRPCNAVQDVGDFTGGMPTMEPPGSEVAFRTIVLRPKIAVAGTASKLFPTRERIQQGNAAPIMLRQNFEATQRLEALRKFTATNYLSMPLKSLDATAITMLTPISFSELRRAAHRERAGWEYPIAEETQPLMGVLLPDVQETRTYSKAIAVRARIDLASGKVDDASDKVLIGLGLSKHVGETPFQICKLVQGANANTLIGVIEELIQHPASENHYWNLAGLPAPFIDTKPALQLEAFVWEKSILQLADLESVSTEKQWQSLVQEIKVYSDMFGQSEARVFDGWTNLARERLPAIWKSEDRLVSSMSDSEVWVRYWHLRTQKLTEECMSWGLLDFHQAIPKLMELRDRREKELADELPVKFASEPPLKLIEVAALLQQHIHMIQTIESIRDWSAKNSGVLPKTLQELDLPAPLDCVVNKPFDYSRSADGKTAILSGAVVENRGFKYELELE